jgi:hypothetical protein
MRPSVTYRAGILAFVTAAVTLFTQVLVHRIVSATLMNNFAFLVISLSMLGFALSGVILSRWRDRLLESPLGGGYRWKSPHENAGKRTRYAWSAQGTLQNRIYQTLT